MFQAFDPTAPADFQIDPFKSPFFFLYQSQAGTDKVLEVGVVWVMGTSRTSSVENWYLYENVPDGSSLAAYTWYGYDATGRLAGGTLRLVPATPPAGETPESLTTYLQRTKGVSLTYVKATCAPGVIGR